MGSLVCGLGDCQTVQASEFATVGPIPVALLGLGMYLVVLACNLVARWRAEQRFLATMAAFTMVLAGGLYAIYLTWIEVAVINAICQWCVISAIITLALLVVEGLALWRLLSGSDEAEGETRTGHAAS